jgi:deoxyadenosine/deoxycytidine kinase
MKIGLCGTMSVGKTTLVKELKNLKQFKNYNFATERSKYLNDLGIPLNTDSTLKGQTVFLAERCAELMNDNIITDRTVIDVMAFASCAKSIYHQESELFIDYAKEFISEYDYVDFAIFMFVQKYGHRVKNGIVQIKGNTDERIQQILKVIES